MSPGTGMGPGSEITLEPRDGYLYVRLKPGFEITLENMTALWNAMSDGCREHGYSDEASRTIAVNTIVVVEVGYLFACRSLRLPSWRIGYFTNPSAWFGAAAMLGVQLALTYVPLMNRLFHTAPIEPWWWGVMTAIGLLVFVLAEARKALLSVARRGPPAPSASSAGAGSRGA